MFSIYMPFCEYANWERLINIIVQWNLLIHKQNWRQHQQTIQCIQCSSHIVQLSCSIFRMEKSIYTFFFACGAEGSSLVLLQLCFLFLETLLSLDERKIWCSCWGTVGNCNRDAFLDVCSVVSANCCRLESLPKLWNTWSDFIDADSKWYERRTCAIVEHCGLFADFVNFVRLFLNQVEIDFSETFSLYDRYRISLLEGCLLWLNISHNICVASLVNTLPVRVLLPCGCLELSLNVSLNSVPLLRLRQE